MSGIAQHGTAIVDGGNLAIAGVNPAGVAAQGQVIWSSIPQWQLLNSVYSGNPNNTLTLDTTGANLLVVNFTNYAYYASQVSDNQGNTWVQGIVNTVAQAYSSTRIFYCINPATSTTHQINFSSGWATVVVMAFKTPANIIAATSSENSNLGNSQTNQLPQIAVPGDSLILTAAGSQGGVINGVDSGFTIPQPTPMAPVTNYWFMLGAGYRLSSGQQSLAPTWTATGATNLRAVMLAFKPYTPWTLIASSTGIAGTVTMDTTGADFLVIVAYAWSTFFTLSDDLGNAWTYKLPASNYTTTAQFAYCIRPTTSAQHTFTSTSSFSVLAFRGNPVFDQYAQGGVSGWQSVASPGAIQATAVPALYVAGVYGSTGGIVISGIDSGFTIVYQDANSVVGCAYYVQDTQAAINPVWTFTGQTMYSSAAMLSFIPA